MLFIVFILIYCILPVVTVNLEQKQFIKRSKVESWGSTSQKEKKKNKLKESENLIQKRKEKEKKVWADDEREEGRLQSESLVQLEGMLRKIETKTKDRS